MANKLNGRGTNDGYSLRRSLEDQGVTTEEGMRAHLSFVHQTLGVNPRLDVTRYRVNSSHPNEVHHG